MGRLKVKILIIPAPSTLFDQDEARLGYLISIAIFDEDNNPFAKTTTIWTNQSNNGIQTSLLTEKRTYTYDGSYTDPKTTNTTYSYDNYGNVNATYFYGDISTSNDNAVQIIEFTYNTDDWIVDKIKKKYTLDSDESTKLGESYYSYDGGSYGDSPTKGDLTKIEEWYSESTNPYNLFEYDSLGNLVNYTDANGHSTIYDYNILDTTSTYAERITDPTGSYKEYRYDLGTGNVLNITDSNDIETIYQYDSYGRLSKIIKPYDSSAYPTVEYIYSDMGFAPENITVLKRVSPGTSDTSYKITEYDGLGNIIYDMFEYDSQNSIISQYYYDNKSRLVLQTHPYFNEISSYGTRFYYDVMDRITNVTIFDIEIASKSYDHWNTTVSDGNGNQRSYVEDAYNNIITVVENNNQDSYFTTYQYNAFGKITNITDNFIEFVTQDDLLPKSGWWKQSEESLACVSKISFNFTNKKLFVEADISELNLSYAPIFSAIILITIFVAIDIKLYMQGQAMPLFIFLPLIAIIAFIAGVLALLPKQRMKKNTAGMIENLMTQIQTLE